jgi:hypothetical protein
METKRWKGTKAADRSALMSIRSKQQKEALGPDKVAALSRKMVKARGHWEGSGKDKHYVWHTKKK